MRRRIKISARIATPESFSRYVYIAEAFVNASVAQSHCGEWSFNMLRDLAESSIFFKMEPCKTINWTNEWFHLEKYFRCCLEIQIADGSRADELAQHPGRKPNRPGLKLVCASETPQQPLDVVEFQRRPRRLTEPPAEFFQDLAGTLYVDLVGHLHRVAEVGTF